MKRASLLLLVLLSLALPVRGHELGTTKVNATFHRDATYRIDILVDPETLRNRLGILATGARPLPAPAADYQKLIEAQAALFLQQVHVRFDDASSVPRFQYVPLQTRAGAVTATIRLEGSIPAGARTFQFRYALPYAPYLLTVVDEAAPGPPERHWVEGEEMSKQFTLGKRSPPLTRSQTALLYLRLGFTHIIPKGLDHILFVLGIFLLSTSWKSLLTQVTAFTIAHSVTLALTIYGIVSLPSTVVEPAIALSIAYVGFENVVTRTVKPWRIALVFAFGLLHGMGFAGVLGELGIPRSEFVTALIAFNAGVELGQLAVIALAFALVASWSRQKRWYRQRVVIPVSILIGITGLYWMIERSAW